MRLSQGHLKQLATCPRQFQHIYLDQFAPPTAIADLARMAEGSQFHLLLQQQSLGLPIAPMLEQDARLQRWFAQFEASAAQMQSVGVEPALEPVLWQQSEQAQTLAFGDHILTVVYDRIMLGQTQGQIFDWKTYPKPPQVKWLQQDWQTKLYLYVLKETSQLAPKNLSMTYWFFPADPTPIETASPTPASPTPAEPVRLRYSQEQHAATQLELTELSDRLTTWLRAYETTGKSLPQVTTTDHCTHCSFATRCGREASPPPSPASTAPIAPLSVAAIAEVSL